MRLLIAIPVFNEQQYVNRVLDRIREYHHDILVVDDGSTDGSAELLRQRSDIQLLCHPDNRGYGASVIDAFNHAHAHGYDWIITMDCDEQHEPESIPSFVREIETGRWDLISGSRYLQVRPDNDMPPGERRSINTTVTDLVNALFGLRLTDSFCGFKAHRVSAMRELRLDEKGYGFPMQLWPRVARAGLRITEIPVRLIYNDPNRHFGGPLDDACYRLKHYLDILAIEYDRSHELDPLHEREISSPALCSGCSCP